MTETAGDFGGGDRGEANVGDAIVQNLIDEAFKLCVGEDIRFLSFSLS